MQAPHINLVSLKPFYTLQASFFEDTIDSVNALLIHAGYQTSVSCNQVDPAVLNIVFGANSHLSPPLSDIRDIAKPEFTVIFNMEQIKYGNSFVTPQYISFLSEYRVWDYNIHNIQAMQRYNPSIRAWEFPVVPSRQFASDYLTAESSTALLHDIAFWGASCPRRDDVLQSLAQQGLKVNRVSGAFGAALSRAIANTKMCTNIHALDSGIFEVARCLRPIAMGLPIVSEISQMPASVDWHRSGIVFCEHAAIHDTCMQLIQEPDRILELTRKNIQFQSELWASGTLKDAVRSIVAN